MAVAGCLLASLAVACSGASGHKVLSIFFDGVPEPAKPVAQAPADGAARTAEPVPSESSVHGPYANRECDACHDRRANNALVAPREELCFRCHDLRLEKAYIHGPLASGGCLVCHDPHRSGFRFLLAADSRTFCVRCHEASAVAAIPAHAGVSEECTACHDAHMSDRRYLLK